MIIHKSRSAIMASKMFKASPRQKEILAAMDDNKNIELVQQLDEYLDDEYFAMKQQAVAEQNNDAVVDTPDGITEPAYTDDSVPSPRRAGGGASPAKFTPNESLMDKHGDELAMEEGDLPAEPTGDEEPKEPNASVQAKGKPIVADTIVNPFVDLYASLVGIANEIKGTLNVRQDTAGVNRVQIKNDELWIFYNDDINLNNVMANVIGILNAANYQYFEFNRLARTENAIVFAISLENTACSVQAVVSNE